MFDTVILIDILVVVCGYLSGSVPWSFLIGKSHGVDLRQHGSGNLGATNVRRVLGFRWGLTCFLLDFAKGLVPVLLALAVGRDRGTGGEFLVVLTAAAAVCGHVWPFAMGFKGGKGVATTIGVVLALAPVPILVAAVTWFVVFKTSRIVSLASLIAAAVLPISGLVLRFAGNGGPSSVRLGLLVVLGSLIIVRHRSNIGRLIRGEEYQFKQTASTSEAEATSEDVSAEASLPVDEKE
ncbi:MAG: glycerol-3-phosphate 1-O-acyltransferase PlsY [Lentisphaerae bacterium]|jgi:acyl phosphate:glycerol-3-phosphate acyltransferase|nr:glycerol-3-phosphate 1-O-acyltransferase PlsY [Lentisphaerota bacterium]MBT4821780.1 glycerol-3-phosphate 1-O-acyltransferase PlsY [Lentisphaerota bacterium]MBT5607893.1 glycerol-3-phosphate 1-O-acyltransferase PlsY [Lentisphaerota bacterium]MBT7062064.1 glycerol-3-phosphate 1-O-acyltransferase PlsY [Lentisphaerota bacterium]MBT7848631.1 glycerol-3-phosphate 1-O-acyltransferase PlsY [Lentisphaerota bacterium]